MIKQSVVGLSVVLALATSASAGQIRITEWAYQGGGGEYIEFTNVSSEPVDMTGWSFDDNSRLPGSVSLSAFGIVNPGVSVILTDSLDTAFATEWSLVGVGIIGGNTNNLGRADEINLYDASSALMDRLTYDDQTIAGCPRTNVASGNPLSSDVLGANACGQWTLSTNGDVYGSYVSVSGGIGNPGHDVPEPASGVLMLSGIAALIRRR